MGNFRYILLIVLVIAAAVAAVLWPKDEAPTISFTRPAKLDNDELESQGQSRSDELVTSTEPGLIPGNIGNEDRLTPSSSATPLTLADEPDLPSEDQLTEAELAEQIKLAQEKLARVEAINAAKQAQVDRMLELEASAGQPLIEAELAYRIGGWRQAWRTGDTNAYFNYYSDAFKPGNGSSMEQWKAQRVKRLNPEKPIDLDLEDFSVTFDPESQRSLVTFKQKYRSGNYQDTSKKRLIMANEQGQWMIIAETTE